MNKVFEGSGLSNSVAIMKPTKEAAKRRLLMDFKTHIDQPDSSFICSPIENDIFRWLVVIFGTEGSMFEDGIFKLAMNFCHDYPYKPPQVKFLTKMFHPNVALDGIVCPEIIERNWTPATNVVLIVKRLQSLLDNPCSDKVTCYNPRAAELFLTNKGEYQKIVNNCVDESLKEDDFDI